MKLSRLLEIHHKNLPSLSLPKNLGDGFLIQNNALYRIVRTKAHQFGFEYSDARNNSYLALPLSQLENVLESKSIPYIDNVSVLEVIKNVATWDDVTDNLKRNNLFHESCHAVARTISTPLFQDLDSPETTIVRLMIEESFANACELLSIIHAEDPAHRIFYEANSYIFMYDDRFQLKKLVEQLGFSRSIKFLIYSYLFSNFLHERINDRDLQRLFSLLAIDKSSPIDFKTLRSVSKIAFELNPRFRWVTTTFYLKLNGLTYSTTQLNQMDFLAIIESQIQFRILLDQLSQAVAE